MPGCPPESHQIAAVIDLVIKVSAWRSHIYLRQERRSVLAHPRSATIAPASAMKRRSRSLSASKTWTHPDPVLCLLEQGVPCNGPATRRWLRRILPKRRRAMHRLLWSSGRSADYGARLITSFASVIDSNDPEEIDRILDGIPDPAGQFYRFNLAGSLLRAGKPAWKGNGSALGGGQLCNESQLIPSPAWKATARLKIFLNEEGDVANTYFQIPELRGFERSCVGRPVEEMPLLTNRICGVCPEAHHMAAAKAADAVYHVRSTASRQKIAGAALQRLLLHRSHHPFLCPWRPRFCHGSRCSGSRAQYPGCNSQSRAGNWRKSHPGQKVWPSYR